MRHYYEGDKRVQRAVKKSARLALGFNDSMSLEAAKALASQLNADNAIKRAEANKVIRIAERVARDNLFHKTYVPEGTNAEFLVWMENNSSGDLKYIQKMKIQWSTAKKAIIALKLLPKDYAFNSKRFYLYFASEEYSLSYVHKLLRTINMYGAFVCHAQDKFYRDIPGPTGKDRERINDAYQNSSSYRGASKGLTLDLLPKLQEGLNEAQYNWIFCSLWFGLRPSELDQILEDKSNQTWFLESDTDVDILWVYQPKLTGVPEDERWKPIPVLYNEQKQALKYILEHNLDKPLTKTVQKYLSSDKYSLYAGRKGFTDLMLDLGQEFHDIAQWMGHTTIDRTWTNYKDRMRVGYRKP